MQQGECSDHHEQSLPEDGIYWIRSITKDRYLDVAFERTEDNAQIIGQTLNPAPTTNQQWFVKSVSTGGRLPVQWLISPVSDSGRHLYAKGGGDTPDVVTNSNVMHWIAIGAPDYRVFKIAPATESGNKVLSLHNSNDWNTFVAPDEKVNFTSEAPKNYHQLWSFVKDPYVR